MSKLLVPFNLDQLGEPREYRPPADRVIEGDIVCRNWDVDSAKDGKVTEKDLGAVKAGDLVVRSCSSCNAITAVKMPKSTKGNYELLSPKCEYCGANTVSVSSGPVRVAAFPKESIKR